MPTKLHSDYPTSKQIFDPPGDVRTTPHLQVFYRDDELPMLNQYIRRTRIGEGQHGKVYLCEEVKQRTDRERALGDNQVSIVRQPVAMKSVRRSNPRAEQLKLLRKHALPNSPHIPVGDKLSTTEAKIRKEIAIMKKCRHAHVVRLLEVIDDRLKSKIYMVMEYLAGGEVKWKNRNDEPILTTSQTNRIMRDAILGLEYLHFQGIIHRDIKPANLLWTEDRSQVKIGDFGVSHFSYAQRLAAAGQGAADDPHDPILLDDTDLTKRAGTPAFIAPEVVYEHTEGATPADRPPITKAIDIWALGVTLYCLLFGKTPFTATSEYGTEFSLYNSICNDDWTVPESMGYDRIPTGGRHPVDENSDGALVIHLLEHFLTKDMRARITLDEVKCYKWFLREVDNPNKWLRVTSPKKIEVTPAETEGAMVSVRFRWKWGSTLTRHISSLLRQVRPQRSRDAIAMRDENLTGTRSSPAALAGKHKGTRLDKGKKRVDARSAKQANPQTTRSKSVERWPVSKLAGPNIVIGSSPNINPASDVNIVPRARSSSQASPSLEERTKSRFSLHPSKWQWRPSKSVSQSTTPVGTRPSSSRITPQSSTIYSPVPRTPSTTSPTSANSPDLAAVVDPLGRGIRRSEEALRGQRSVPCSTSGPLTAARRASSWGDNPTEFNEVTSLNSDDHDLDEHALIVGAGGVSNELPFRRNPSVGLRLNAYPLTQLAYDSAPEGHIYHVYPDYELDDSSTFASARSLRDVDDYHSNGREASDTDQDTSEDDDSESHNTHISFDAHRRRITAPSNPQARER